MPSWAWCPTTACTSSRNGIAASRRESAGDARAASSHMRTPIRTSRSGPRVSRPCVTSSATSRDAVATCSPARRASTDTGSAGSSGVNASRMRTARASEDSPVAVRAIGSVCRLSHPLRRCWLGHIGRAHPSGMTATLPRTASVGADVATLRVVGKTVVAEDVMTLELAAPSGGRLRDWTPGSHVDLLLPNGLTRQYSLCGDRRDPGTYRVGVLREPAGHGGSAFVHDELAVGDVVGVAGPRNNFPLVPSEQYLFVAGGIGITPLLPMIAQAELLGADWRLLYGGRRRGSMAFLDELAAYGERVLIRPEDEHGLLDLPQFLGRPRDGVRVYACGPAPLLAAMERACAGRAPHTLRTERFVPGEPATPARTAAFEVELARTGITVTVTPQQTGLDALNGVGVEVLSSCRRGVCGTCETTVLAGRPDHRDALLDDDERNANDCMYVCVSRSRDERLVLDL